MGHQYRHIEFLADHQDLVALQEEVLSPAEREGSIEASKVQKLAASAYSHGIRRRRTLHGLLEIDGEQDVSSQLLQHLSTGKFGPKDCSLTQQQQLIFIRFVNELDLGLAKILSQRFWQTYSDVMIFCQTPELAVGGWQVDERGTLIGTSVVLFDCLASPSYPDYEMVCGPFGANIFLRPRQSKTDETVPLMVAKMQLRVEQTGEVAIVFECWAHQTVNCYQSVVDERLFSDFQAHVASTQPRDLRVGATEHESFACKEAELDLGLAAVLGCIEFACFDESTWQKLMPYLVESSFSDKISGLIEQWEQSHPDAKDKVLEIRGLHLLAVASQLTKETAAAHSALALPCFSTVPCTVSFWDSISTVASDTANVMLEIIKIAAGVDDDMGYRL